MGLFFQNKSREIKVCKRCSALDIAAVENAAKQHGYTLKTGCIGQCCRDASKDKAYIAKVAGKVISKDSQEEFLKAISQ